MRAVSFAVLASACGRLGFGDPGAIEAAGEQAPRPDAPLPATLVCRAGVISGPMAASNAQLAVTTTAQGFLGMWIDPAAALQSIVIEPAVTGDVTRVLAGPIDALGGVSITPQTTLIVTASGGNQTLWAANPLTSPVEVTTESTVVARAPLMIEASSGSPRVWTRGDPTGLIASYVSDGGAVGPIQMIATTNPVVDVSTADNFGHGHLTWELATTPHGCFQADMSLGDITRPMLGGSSLVSADCTTPRMTSGPLGSDAIFTAYATSAGEIAFRYLGSIADLGGVLSPRGRAPKVAFDGSQFWVGWLDESTASTVLRIAKVLQDGTSQVVDLPGWLPVSDYAFALITRTTTTFLAILGPDSLALLQTCP